MHIARRIMGTALTREDIISRLLPEPMNGIQDCDRRHYWLVYKILTIAAY